MRVSRSGVALAMAGILTLSSAAATVPTQAREATALLALPASPIPGLSRNAGLWNKPNEACITRCEVFVNKGCFKELAEKNPDADAAALQEQCDDKFSLCLYDCMCDTCDENQIIIKQP